MANHFAYFHDKKCTTKQVHECKEQSVMAKSFLYEVNVD